MAFFHLNAFIHFPSEGNGFFVLWANYFHGFNLEREKCFSVHTQMNSEMPQLNDIVDEWARKERGKTKAQSLSLFKIAFYNRFLSEMVLHVIFDSFACLFAESD